MTAHWSASHGGAAAVGGGTREALVFYGGLLAVAMALVSPVGYWSVQYIWVRTVQDLLLAMVAPPLIVLGAPWLALRTGAQVIRSRLGGREPPPAPAEPHPAKSAAASSVTSGRSWWLSTPVLVAVAFNVIWCAWHLPALFDLALTSRLAYAAEVITYLVAGTAFWLELIGSAPLSPRLSPLRRVTLVCGTVIAGTVLGMVLVFGSSLLYPAYPGGSHHVLSVVADQQVGGAVLWMGMLPPFLIVAVALLLNWLNAEEDEALTDGLERLLSPAGGIPARRAGPRKYTWPSGRGLK